MQPAIDTGELDGKLECPKCKAKVGTYAWQGMRCSCGKWVTPSFTLGKSKVDEVRRVRPPAGGTVVTRPVGDAVKSRV
jgi:dual specificity phosphatase 12